MRHLQNLKEIFFLQSSAKKIQLEFSTIIKAHFLVIIFSNFVGNKRCCFFGRIGIINLVTTGAKTGLGFSRLKRSVSSTPAPLLLRRQIR